MSSPALSMAMPMRPTAPKGRILCVDDEPNILRALCWMLQKDFEVLTAASGQEGLDLVRRNDFDVVISDQKMPGMSGVDFLREVRVAAPRAMRILLTGYSDLGAVLRSVNESEIFRYVTKPWDVTELPRIIAQATEIARDQPAGIAYPALGEEILPDAREAKILVLGDDIEIHAAVELCAGDLAQVVHVTNVADAVHLLHGMPVGAIVAESRMGSLDLTRLICLMKQRYPQVVSVILAEETDVDTVTKLVNQGQIFRFIPKPLEAVGFRATLRSALIKSQQLKLLPELGHRHAVEPLPDEEIDFRPSASGPAHSYQGASYVPPLSFGSRMGRLFRRIFAGPSPHA